MKESLEKALARRFHIYVQNPNNEVPFTIFRFECGPGWVPLLIEFAQTAERLDVYDVQIGQIKEKWDALRIYFTAAGLDQDALEDIALDLPSLIK
ncbi:hypothetical protein KDX31_17415 [Amphritea atlantica]|uniref:DUF1902 domain-containing protein n=1 Tax=Amphritea atlantica TaxID=355243 RepID=A0ABY5GTT1_9GAMM|nr:hypothetical protein KDX31_17415 [Amphritea atlantica]